MTQKNAMRQTKAQKDEESQKKIQIEGEKGMTKRERHRKK